jgi:hypothetical protein
MTHRITLVTPDAPAQSHPPGALVAQRKIEKRGIRLGVLDNSKGNADHLLAMIVEGVRAEVPVASVVSLRKPHVTFPASGAMLDQLAAEADFVVSAMAD